MRIRFSRRFLKSYELLSSRDRASVDHALETFETHPASPGLHLEKLTGFEDLWSIRANARVRVILRRTSEEEIEALDVGGHELYRLLRKR